MLALAAVPEAERVGPLAKNESGQPWADGKKFAKAWREIATAAGVPKSVWNMDSCAGGISEACRRIWRRFAKSESGMADQHRPRQRYGETFWRAHHEAWKRGDLNQREYCEVQMPSAEGI